jgi:hypothetical protein
MDKRKEAILRAITDDYIETAEPVGSRTIARKYSLGVSPATIRNEMADLEESGYLQQPHTSAGRIPSDKGYRFYVDVLIPDPRVSEEEMVFVREKMMAPQVVSWRLLLASPRVCSFTWLWPSHCVWKRSRFSSRPCLRAVLPAPPVTRVCEYLVLAPAQEAERSFASSAQMLMVQMRRAE